MICLFVQTLLLAMFTLDYISALHFTEPFQFSLRPLSAWEDSSVIKLVVK